MHIEHKGKWYQLIRASDLERDGMGLELQLEGRTVAEAFYGDVSGDLTISLFEPALPLPVIEHFIARAKVSLLPMGGNSEK